MWPHLKSVDSSSRVRGWVVACPSTAVIAVRGDTCRAEEALDVKIMRVRTTLSGEAVQCNGICINRTPNARAVKAIEQ